MIHESLWLKAGFTQYVEAHGEAGLWEANKVQLQLEIMLETYQMGRPHKIPCKTKLHISEGMLLATPLIQIFQMFKVLKYQVVENRHKSNVTIFE